MTLDTLERPGIRSREAASRILLSPDDDSGGWTLSELDGAARRFTDYEAALAWVRQVPALQAATIEIWQQGDYIFCLPPEEWLHGASFHRAPSVQKARAFTAVERYANRAAEVVFAVAGPLFWLALMLVAMAASLGWRLLLF